MPSEFPSTHSGTSNLPISWYVFSPPFALEWFWLKTPQSWRVVKRQDPPKHIPHPPFSPGTLWPLCQLAVKRINGPLRPLPSGPAPFSTQSPRGTTPSLPGIYFSRGLKFTMKRSWVGAWEGLLLAAFLVLPVRASVSPASVNLTPGTVNYIEGQVSLDGTPLNDHSAGAARLEPH